MWVWLAITREAGRTWWRHRLPVQRDQGCLRDNREPLRTLKKGKKQVLLELGKGQGYRDLLPSARVSVLGHPAKEET